MTYLAHFPAAREVGHRTKPLKTQFLVQEAGPFEATPDVLRQKTFGLRHHRLHVHAPPAYRCRDFSGHRVAHVGEPTSERRRKKMSVSCAVVVMVVVV